MAEVDQQKKIEQAIEEEAAAEAISGEGADMLSAQADEDRSLQESEQTIKKTAAVVKPETQKPVVPAASA